MEQLANRMPPPLELREFGFVAHDGRGATEDCALFQHASPGDDAPGTRTLVCSADVVDSALLAARTAFEVDCWSRQPGSDCADVLLRAAATNFKKPGMELGGQNSQIATADRGATVDCVAFDGGHSCGSGSGPIRARSVADECAGGRKRKVAHIRVGGSVDATTRIDEISTEAQNTTPPPCFEKRRTEGARAASVWSKNIDKAMMGTRRVRAGRVWVNTTHADGPELPMGSANRARGEKRMSVMSRKIHN